MRRTAWTTLRALAVLLAVGCLSQLSVPASEPTRTTEARVHSARLPKWEGPDRPVREAPERLEPYAIRSGSSRGAPTTGVVRPMVEWQPMQGVLFQFDRFGWPEFVAEMVAALTADPADDEIAWVLVASPQQQNKAITEFTDAGADMSKVVFIEAPTESIWVRDWGPQFVWLDDTLAIVDNRYFTSRPNDNFIPRLLAEDLLNVPSYEPGLWHFGGNFLANANGDGFVTSIVNTANPDFGDSRVAELFGTYKGINTLHVFPTLPTAVDATGHIDMWFQFADHDTVVISEFLPGSDPTAIAITDNAADYMEQVLGYEVFRVPAHNGWHPNAANTHFTYSNTFRVNDKLFVPTYASGDPTHAARDAEALATWQLAAPGAQIVPIDAWGIVYAAGVLHCTVMQMPQYGLTDPSANVISPAGGEVWVPGSVRTVEWSASDDVSVASIDLSYSTDGGMSWSPIATGLPHTRTFDWTVPAEAGSTARLQVVAHDDVAATGQAVSAGDWSIVAGDLRTYDFSTGAGVEHRAWGYMADDWFEVAGQRLPALLSTELTPAEYLALSAPDATGGAGDSNRFVSPTPPTGFRSAQVFEFTVDEVPALWLELTVLWEGWGDSCQQVELYIWDHVAGDWGDGSGQCGEKSYVDSASGNRDVTMRGSIRQDFDRYVDADGKVTLLTFHASAEHETLHDYIALELTHVGNIDADSDAVPDVLDCAPADAALWTAPGETDGLLATPDVGGTRLDWSVPVDPGAQSIAYDLLASSSVDGFDLGSCVVTGTAATTAIDAVDPAPGELRSYLVRAVNACGDGSVGDGSGGLTRTASSCP